MLCADWWPPRLATGPSPLSQSKLLPSKILLRGGGGGGGGGGGFIAVQ